MSDQGSDQPVWPPRSPAQLPPELQQPLARPPPSAWVARHLAALPEGARVLDVACGTGRHLELLLQAGMRAVGVDRDISKAAGYEQVPDFELIAFDLEGSAPPPFAGERFDGVIVTNYLWRPLLPAVVAAVADTGILIYETFAVGNERFGRPTNPDFLLRPNELVEAVAGRLCTVAFEHVVLDTPRRVVQRIAAVGRAHAWAQVSPPPLPVLPRRAE